jgi:F-type H+-transporting ATPase subunit a
MDFRPVLNSKKITLGIVLSVFSLFVSVKASALQEKNPAESTTETKEEAKVDPTETIMEHISDSHYFHMGGKLAMPLPVILYTDKGLEVFMSSVFEEGEKIHEGKYHKYALIHDKIKAVTGEDKTEDTTAKVFDLSITKNVASMLLSMVILLLIFLSIASTYKKRVGKAPKGLQSFFEPIILFVRDEIALPNIGYKYARFMPLLLTVFFFILINNLIGLVPFFPGGSNLTGNIAVTMVLSVITLLVVNLNGNKHYWAHIFVPSSVPVWLWPLWWVVELLGIFSKPFALMIRLFANITAGHIIVLSLISLIFVFKSVAIAPVSVAFVVFMDVLELLVACLQAFIFTLLTALFIGTAIEEHHH